MLERLRVFPSLRGECYSFAWLYPAVFVHLSVGGHLKCFCVLAIMDNAAINIWVHVLTRYMFSFLVGM